MNEEAKLHGASSWQRKPKQTSARLGEEVSSYMKQRDRMLKKNAAIVDVWEQAIPPALRPFCRLDNLRGHTLFVQVRPGPYMHQVQMLSGELLEQINRQVPRSGIQVIRIIPLSES